MSTSAPNPDVAALQDDWFQEMAADMAPRRAKPRVAPAKKADGAALSSGVDLPPHGAATAGTDAAPGIGHQDAPATDDADAPAAARVPARAPKARTPGSRGVAAPHAAWQRTIGEIRLYMEDPSGRRLPCPTAEYTVAPRWPIEDRIQGAIDALLERTGLEPTKSQLFEMGVLCLPDDDDELQDLFMRFLACGPRRKPGRPAQRRGSHAE